MKVEEEEEEGEDESREESASHEDRMRIEGMECFL